jgi:hypothetical protein
VWKITVDTTVLLVVVIVSLVSAPGEAIVIESPTATIADDCPAETLNFVPWPCGSPETEYFPELAWLLQPEPWQLYPSKRRVSSEILALLCFALLPKLAEPSLVPHASQSQPAGGAGGGGGGGCGVQWHCL